MGSAYDLITKRIGLVKQASDLYETAPWGGIEQPAFLNQVLEVETECEPEEVLRLILDIEHELGRVRYEHWGARHIDIDLLYYGSVHRATARLTLPHPRLHERRFTLVPLAQIAPDFIHPLLHKTNAELLEACTDQEEVNLFESRQQG